MAETIKGINIKLSLDGKDLEKDLKAINSNLKSQQKDLTAINRNLRYDSKNLDLWREKQGKLNQVLEDTKKKLANQNGQLERAKEAVKIGAMSEEEFTKLKRNVRFTEADVARLNQELGRTNDQIRQLSRARFDQLAKLGGTLTKSLTLPIVAAASALSALAIKSAYAADHIGDSAAKIGLSAESLQEWNHTAKILGSSSESLGRAFIRVNSILGQIVTGNGDKFSESLAQIGLSIDDLKGKDADTAFSMLRDALSSVEDASVRVGVANTLFGEKIASELIPVLSSERKAITELREEAQRLGIVTNEQADIAGQFTDTLDRTRQAFSSLMIDLSMIVMPTLNRLIEKVRDDVIPRLKGWIEAWNQLEGSTKRVILILTGLVAAVGPVLTIIGRVGPVVQGLALGFKALGVSGFFAGAGLNFATLGIGALVALVTTALVTNESFRESLMRLTEAAMSLLEPILEIGMVLVTALKPVFNTLINLVVSLLDILMPLVNLLLEPLIMQFELWADIIHALAPAIRVLGNVIQAILIPILGYVEKTLQPILWIIEKIVWVIERLFGWLSRVTSKMSGVKTSFSDLTQGVRASFSDLTSSLANQTSGFVERTLGSVGNLLGTVRERLFKTLESTQGFMQNVHTSLNGLFDQSLSNIQATFGVNLVSLSQVTSKMSESLKSAVQSVGSFLNHVGGRLMRSGNLKQESTTVNTQQSTTATSTTNHVTINTTSSKFDIDSINKALGGNFI